MFGKTKAFSGFSVDDLGAAKQFYGETLGIEVTEEPPHGLLTLHIAGDRPILVYPKQDHVPASFTILNFPVDDIEGAVGELTSRGVTFLRYEGHRDGDRRAGDLPEGRSADRLVRGSGRERALAHSVVAVTPPTSSPAPRWAPRTGPTSVQKRGSEPKISRPLATMRSASSGDWACWTIQSVAPCSWS